MRGRLSSNGGSGLISPLIDVIFNSMGAMFIFLIIYIAIVRPRSMQMLDTQPPEAVWYKGYEWAVSVGEPSTRFTLEGKLPEGLTLESRTGVLRGTPIAADGAEKTAQVFPFAIRAIDATGRSTVRPFALKVAPVSVPFDPNEEVLRLQCRDPGLLPEGYMGLPYEVVLGIVGGIEPYRVVQCDGLPPGLGCRQGRIAGTPTAAGDYEFTIVVEDEQDKYGILRTAGHSIEARQNYRIRIRTLEEIYIEPFLPLARVGQPYKGVILARGGKGELRWSTEAQDTLARHGLTLDPNTGVVRAEHISSPDPTRVSRAVFPIIVDDLGEAVASRSQECAILILPPMHFCP